MKYKVYFKNGESVKFESKETLSQMRLNVSKGDCFIDSHDLMCRDCPIPRLRDICFPEKDVEKIVKLVKKKKKPVVKSYKVLMDEWTRERPWKTVPQEYVYNYFIKEVLK